MVNRLVVGAMLLLAVGAFVDICVGLENHVRLLLSLTLAAWLFRRFFCIGSLRDKFGRYAALRRVPTVADGHWFLGQVRLLKPEVALSNWRSWLRQHPRILRLSRGPLTDFIVLHHPEEATAILRDSQHPREEYIYSFLKPWLGNGLLTDCQGDCRARRRPLLAAQGPQARARHAKIFANVAQDLFALWDAKCAEREGGFVTDVEAAMRMLSLDVIVQCAFSERLGRHQTSANDNDGEGAVSEAREYARTVPKLLRMTVDRLLTLHHHVDYFFWNSKKGRDYGQLLDTVHRFTDAAIRRRIEGRKRDFGSSDLSTTSGGDSPPSSSPTADSTNPGVKARPSSKACSLIAGGKEVKIQCPKPNGFCYETATERDEKDFLDVLLRQYGGRGDQNEKTVAKQIRDDLDTLVFAGHDTTASALAWSLYYLALHKDALRRCQEEVDIVLRSHPLVNGDSLPYLTQCVKESLRLASVVPNIHRNLSRNCEVAGHRLSAGTRVLVSLWAIHHNPTVWPQVDEFLPERFGRDTPSGVCNGTSCIHKDASTPSGRCTLHATVKGSFNPFSVGPRACLGQSMAMHELTTVLAMLIGRYHFTFEWSQENPHPVPTPVMVMRATNGIHLKVERRSPTSNK